MRPTYSRILITLRDGGSLTRDVCRSHAELRRKDRSDVAKVRRRPTLADLVDSWGYLRFTTTLGGLEIYHLTADGLAIARSIRNKVTP